MDLNPQIAKAVEELGYRVTSGDVATRTGLRLEKVRGELLALASEARGHLQVTDTGEIVFNLPQNFRDILSQKYWQLRWQATWQWIWQAIVYLTKISFGIFLIASIAIVYLAIALLAIAAICGSDGNGDCGDCGSCDGFGSCVLEIGDATNGGWCFDSNSSATPATEEKKRKRKKGNRLDFLQAVFSFIFGDGNPNKDLEARRWQYIGNTIVRQKGVIIAEQVAPFLDNLGSGFDREYEQYMLPILVKFNGQPEVSPTGQLVYHFPELQQTLQSSQTETCRAPIYLKERKWEFSKATSGQISGAIALGIANIVGIGILSSILIGSAAGSGLGFVIFVRSIIGLLAGYGVGFLTIPFLRRFWVKYKANQVVSRNKKRRAAVRLMEDTEVIPEKLAFAQQFAKRQQIEGENIIDDIG
jgi:hypothetical protein